MMNRTWPFVLIGALSLGGALFLGNASLAGGDSPARRILIVSGPSSHPPGTHESAAGARLLAHLLETAKGIGPVKAQVVTEWPHDKAALEGLSAIVFTGDLFPGETLSHPEAIKADLEELTKHGCGIVCLHYATGLQAKHVTETGDHPLLRWIGGYFATGCKHHQSVARMVTATLTPEPIAHPVLHGWKMFTFDDEPYWNNYFGPHGLAPNVTALVTTMLPPEAPEKEIVVWAVERPDGGRGLGAVIPHYYRNWLNDDVRILLMNAVCWTAKIDIPTEGVKTDRPDLAQFGPAAVEPPAPAKPTAP